ncbi:Uncharacterized protein Fot_21474 [Forsythia ovata]|uniref:Uncharacterized protein n=1 Tax=Forsythia ovata TaxID=205694 RepID=A0ABD1UWU4_9LAMI
MACMSIRSVIKPATRTLASVKRLMQWFVSKPPFLPNSFAKNSTRVFGRNESPGSAPASRRARLQPPDTAASAISISAIIGPPALLGSAICHHHSSSDHPTAEACENLHSITRRDTASASAVCRRVSLPTRSRSSEFELPPPIPNTPKFSRKSVISESDTIHV